MGKIRDIFKKIRDIKGIFHAKIRTIKDRNVTDLKEAEYLKKKKGGENSQSCAKKIFRNQIIMIV